MPKIAETDRATRMCFPKSIVALFRIPMPSGVHAAEAASAACASSVAESGTPRFVTRRSTPIATIKPSVRRVLRSVIRAGGKEFCVECIFHSRVTMLECKTNALRILFHAQEIGVDKPESLFAQRCQYGWRSGSHLRI